MNTPSPFVLAAEVSNVENTVVVGLITSLTPSVDVNGIVSGVTYNDLIQPTNLGYAPVETGLWLDVDDFTGNVAYWSESCQFGADLTGTVSVTHYYIALKYDDAYQLFGVWKLPIAKTIGAGQDPIDVQANGTVSAALDISNCHWV